MATAKHRAIDATRRNRMLDRKHEVLAHELEVQKESDAAAIEEAIDDTVGDDLLRLIFIACHPVLPSKAQLARYPLLPSVRADLLSRLGRFAGARSELQRAQALTRNAQELELLRRRMAALRADSLPPRDGNPDVT